VFEEFRRVVAALLSSSRGRGLPRIVDPLEGAKR